MKKALKFGLREGTTEKIALPGSKVLMCLITKDLCCHGTENDLNVYCKE